MRVEVTAAIVMAGDSVLLARRAKGKREAGKWEFPGGKREPGETLEECLRRELYEELGVSACVREEMIRTEYIYRHSHIHLIAFRTILAGTPLLSGDHDQLKWVPISSIHSFDLSPADLPIADHLLGLQVGFQ